MQITLPASPLLPLCPGGVKIMLVKERRVVLFLIDGMKREVFYNLLSGGKLPGFGALFSEGVWVRYGTTVFPSETLPSQASLFTGCQVRRHRIVGNAWLDRTRDPVSVMNFNNASTAAAVYGYGVVGLPTGILPMRDPEGLLNRELNPEVPTIYELAREAGLTSNVVFNHYSRGATRWVRPGRSAILYFALSYKLRAGFRTIDVHTAGVTLSTIRKHGLPNLLVVYFPGLDTWGHYTDDHGQVRYITRVLDPQIRKIVRELEKMKALDNTIFAVTSDHGQTWVGADTRMIPVETLARALSQKGYNPATRAERAIESDCFVTVVGGCAHIYVKNRDTGDWKNLPALEHLLPAANCLSSICMLEHPEKRGCPDGECTSLIFVRTSLDEAYQVYHNGEIVPLEKFFWEKLERYPQVFKNIYGLNSIRSGDIVVFSNFEKGCYISDSHWTRSHGGLSLVDTAIPIIFSGPGVPRRVVERASILDVAPTILDLLGVRETRMDGRSLRLFTL